MSDLISRADAIKVFINWGMKEFGFHDLNRNERFIDALSALPSAEPEEAVLNKMLKEEMIILPQDYVKVVRCKDCRYRNKIGTLYYCDLDEYNVKDADFCSWGERREE